MASVFGKLSIIQQQQLLIGNLNVFNKSVEISF